MRLLRQEMQLRQPTFLEAVGLIESYVLTVVHVVTVTGITTKFISHCLALLSTEMPTVAANESDFTVVFYYVYLPSAAF